MEAELRTAIRCMSTRQKDSPRLTQRKNPRFAHGEPFLQAGVKFANRDDQ